ncbi:hypothetical protein GCM10027449_26780 [Sinomonas notoginsengisoli]|uniref:hypothetical protein n=1 Tax=Sinomonas notoginsengisoli TaxID=1457311 RepID=UPI001F2A0A52|nr:hypothetical protein [Sinomonas notoginsengisoli]
MSNDTIARQPKGIPIGGQFAATAHAEPGITLAAPAGQTPTREQVIDQACDYYGEGMRPSFEKQFEEVSTEAGEALLVQSLDGLYNPDSPHQVDRTYYGVKPRHCDALAELGYTDVSQVALERTKNLRGVDTIVENRISPDRLEVIGALPTHEHQWSAWEKEAYFGAPVDGLRAANGDPSRTRLERYTDTVTLGHPERAARIEEAVALGIGDKGLIESTAHPLPVLAGIRERLTESRRNAMTVVGYADRGITAEHLKSWGVNACDRFDAADLEASGIRPAVLRSFMGSGVHTSLESYRRLNEAGYTKGADLKAASKAMGTTSPDTLAEVRRHATGEQLARYAPKIRAGLTVADAEAIGTLAKHGIEGPDELNARFVDHVHRPAAT